MVKKSKIERARIGRNLAHARSKVSARAVAWKSTDILAHLRQVLKTAGEDPKVIANEPFRLLRLPDVIAKTGLSERTIYARIAIGEFPRSIPIDRAVTR